MRKVDRIVGQLTASYIGDSGGSVGRSYPVYDLLHGIIQHNVYHSGQIALLRVPAA